LSQKFLDKIQFTTPSYPPPSRGRNLSALRIFPLPWWEGLPSIPPPLVGGTPKYSPSPGGRGKGRGILLIMETYLWDMILGVFVPRLQKELSIVEKNGFVQASIPGNQGLTNLILLTKKSK